MGKGPRIRASNAGFCFNLYPAQTDDHWSVIRRVHAHQGEAKIASGEWKREYDGMGNQIGYRVVPNKHGDASLQSGASSGSITKREIELNAGLRGQSRTVSMSEEDRISRKHPKSGRALPPEDEIERAVRKVREWPQMHGDRAVRVYPKIVNPTRG